MLIPTDISPLTALLAELKANLVVVNVTLQRYIVTRDIDYLERVCELRNSSAPNNTTDKRVCCDAQ